MRGAGALRTPEDPDVPAPPTLARVPEPRATVDDQILRLESRLLAEAAGDPDREQALLGHLARARARFATATIRQFLPILIEREVRRLAAQ